MSWDNVKGVSVAQIWTDNPDMTQVYLFANGNHQVKLTVGLSFTLSNTTQPGPTADEVKAALSLVDYETGAGVRFVKTGAKGSYDYVYQPNMPETINILSASDTSNPGAYQYELDYYVSSDSTINANYASEKVALYLSYINSSGTKVDYYTSSGSKSQSYVTVTVYPPKTYGMADSAIMLVIFTTIDDQFQIDKTQVSGWVNHLYAPTVTLYGIRIDDGYFRFSKFKVDNSLQAPNAFIQHTVSNSSDNNDYNYVFAHSFLPQESHLYSDEKYDASMNIMSEDNWTLVEYTGHFNQQSGEILIARIKNEVIYTKGGPGAIADSKNIATITAYDQFGNEVNIVVDGNGDGYPELASVN